jgi:Na+(H+)/acetate symporter ActP
MQGTTWVYIMLGIYIVYCFYWGLKGYFTEKTSSGYAIAGRSIPFVAFLMASTAASFSGWTFIGHPGAIWKFGLAYAFASFYVITIPITGTFFSKRTWLMGKRYGFITPGDMYAYYYNSEAVRWLVVLAATLYAVFYSALQLMASAALFKRSDRNHEDEERRLLDGGTGAVFHPLHPVVGVGRVGLTSFCSETAPLTRFRRWVMDSNPRHITNMPPV